MKSLVPTANAEKEWDKVTLSVKWLEEQTNKTDEALSEYFSNLDKNASKETIAKQVKEFRQWAEAAKGAFQELSPFKALEDTFENLGKKVVRTNKSIEAVGVHGERAAELLQRSFEVVDLEKTIRDKLVNATEPAIQAAAESLRSVGVDIGELFTGGAGRADAIQKIVDALIAAKKAGDDLKDSLPNNGGDILNKINDQFKVMSDMSIGDKIINAFDTAPLERMIAKQKYVNKNAFDFSKTLQSAPQAFYEMARSTEEAGKKFGKAFDIKTPKDLAAALFDLNDAADKSVSRARDVGVAIQDIVSQTASLFGQLSSLYAQQASYHKQMADQALETGKSQAELYIDLADAVYYSNNKQAQSFTDRAIAAEKAAAKQYEAEKEAQAKSNRLAKRNFENQKQLQIAQALASTAAAVAGQLAMQPVGPWNVGLAAALGALGAAQVAIIQKQQYTPRETGGSALSTRTHIVGESGPEIFVPGRSGTVLSQKTIAEALLSNNGGGDVNVTFQINAIDTQSGAEFLLANRGQIVNMVSQATNERMRR